MDFSDVWERAKRGRDVLFTRDSPALGQRFYEKSLQKSRLFGCDRVFQAGAHFFFSSSSSSGVEKEKSAEGQRASSSRTNPSKRELGMTTAA